MISLQVWHLNRRVSIVRILVVENSSLCILYIACEKMQSLLISGGLYCGFWHCSFVRNVGVGSTFTGVWIVKREGNSIFPL